MKQGLLFLFVFLCFGVMSLSAQDKKGRATSIIASFSPYTGGYMKMSLEDSKVDKAKYFYKSGFGGSLSLEKQFGGHISETEVSFLTKTFDYSEIDEHFTIAPPTFEDLSVYSLTQYYGFTLFGRNKRVQLPVYVGVGGSYIHGTPIHNLFFDLAAKARLKFYISNKFGIFVGATAKRGWGGKEIESNDKIKLDLIDVNWNVNAGLIYSW